MAEAQPRSVAGSTIAARRRARDTRPAATTAGELKASVEEALTSAREAGLSYVSDERPGMRRQRAGKGFRYIDTDGRTVRDPAVLARIRKLAIPPAWTEVWICPSVNGHLQATGHDARGRKQYRYHERWRAVRDENKFGRLVDFARALTTIRRKVAADLRLPGLPREKVLAAVVRLLETTFIRIGNERYARENGSFGLTTMRNRHVRIRGERIAFDFRGKSGIKHHIELEDGRLARVIQRCLDLPGYELFQYVDAEGEPRSIGSSDVNEYLRSITGEDYTAKDFRTWAGTVLAVLALKACECPRSETHARRILKAAIAEVAQQLGNTVAVCRKCYIHPRVLDVFMEGVGRAEASAYLTDVALLSATRRRAVEDAVVRLLTAGKRRAPRLTGATVAASRPESARPPTAAANRVRTRRRMRVGCRARAADAHPGAPAGAD